MDKCDKCFKKSAELKKIVIDWDGTYVMVCPSCVAERGEYAIACRFDRARAFQDAGYAARAHYRVGVEL